MTLSGDATGFIGSQGEYRPINKHLQFMAGGIENPVADYPTTVGSRRTNGRWRTVTEITKSPGADCQDSMSAQRGEGGQAFAARPKRGMEFLGVPEKPYRGVRPPE